jgi:hypothetical protein
MSTMDSHLEIYLKFPLVLLRGNRGHILFLKSKKGKLQRTNGSWFTDYKTPKEDSVCAMCVCRSEKERDGKRYR